MKQFVFLLLLVPTIIFSQNKLDRAKDKLKEKPKTTRNKGKQNVNSSDDASIGEFGRSFLVSLFGDLIFKPLFNATIGYFE